MLIEDAKQIKFKRTKEVDESLCTFLSNEFEWLLENKKYTWIFKIDDKPSKYKMHTTIIEIKVNNKPKKCLSQKINHCFIPLLWKVENAYITKKLKSHEKGKDICEENEITLKINPDSQALWDPHNLNNLSFEDIKAIIENTNKEKLNLFFWNTTLKKIKKFRDEWNESIKNETEEKSFQTLLKENQELLIFLFPRIGNVSFGDDNLADLMGKNKNHTIIKLKRPDSEIFVTSSIKNIVGISRKLITAIIQLSLYCKKILHYLSKEEVISTEVYGILIYGNNDQINSPEEKNAWTLFKEKFCYQIYTFSEITERLNKIIKLLEKQSKNC